MGMWKLHGCPRCGGDMFLQKDEYGWCEQCLQCSYSHQLESMYEFRKALGKGDGRQVETGVTRR